MTPEQLRREVAKGKVATVYLFTGAETRLKREAIGTLVGLVPQGVRDFNVQVFHAFESDLAEVLSAAATLPFLGERRVVILRDIEKMRTTEGRGKLLDEYLKAPAPETILVVTTEDDDRAKSLIKRHGDSLVVVVFNPLKGAALTGAVQREAARLGCAIDAAAIAALLEGAGGDQALVYNELAKLRLAVGDGNRIDVAAVTRYAAGYVHHKAFDIVDAVSRRDLPGSLRLIGEVAIKDEDFLGLLGMLGKRLRVLWYLAGGAREVPKEFRVYPGQLEKLRSDGRRFSRAEIEGGLAGLALLDDRVKSTAVAPKLLLEHFLLGFLTR